MRVLDIFCCGIFIIVAPLVLIVSFLLIVVIDVWIKITGKVFDKY